MKDQMTSQEIFDIAVSGVLGQGGVSVDLYGNCLYNGPKGRHCAAGWVFRAMGINPAEETNARSVIYDHKDQITVNEDNVVILGKLQTAHDSIAQRALHDDVEQLTLLASYFREVARIYNLDDSACNTRPSCA